MNIFVLSTDPIAAARMQCDQHVVSQTKETAQILCTVSHLLRKDRVCECIDNISKGINLGWSKRLERLKSYKEPYKPTHRNHPVVRWVMSNYAHWLWTGIHGRALADEYTYRFGKDHASFKVIWEMNNHGESPRPIGGALNKVKYCLAMPDEYKGDDPVEAYRHFYIGEKKRFARWTNKRPPPTWWPYDSAPLSATI